MDYLAHSAANGRPPQTYERHAEGVSALAERFARDAAAFAQKDADALVQTVLAAAAVHDLGKLDSENQRVLHAPDGAKHLPVHHQDAGAAYLVNSDRLLAALLVKSHHTGLKDLDDEASNDKLYGRDADPKTRARTDEALYYLTRLHTQLADVPHGGAAIEAQGDIQVFLRMGLSCLADADHTDTARFYGRYPADETEIPLNPEARLAQLDAYAASLGGDDARSALRREMYACCRNAAPDSDIAECDGPVGTGKTIAVMAQLLMQAIRRGGRRIFVVLPYTSIISQSVAVYRKCLTLPGEDAERVVAELHCRADFEDEDTRSLTALWRAPIVVTTAAAFFETLASNMPAALRRLHELPGSMIFVDECHAALPVKLLPVAWRWMNVLAEDWGCYWVLASGSLVRFWQLEDFCEKGADVSNIVGDDLHRRLMQYEDRRVTFLAAPEPMSRGALIDWVEAAPGPRLLIVNTVQTAAILADDMRKKSGRARVEHLSTALTAKDREATLRRIAARLADAGDADWTLVATSCVEAGVDFSFRTGFRETASLMSLLQASGRVNRGGAYGDADMWSFDLQDDSLLTRNPRLDTSARVLRRFFVKNKVISPELSTKAVRNEVMLDDSAYGWIMSLLAAEKSGTFPRVAADFNVIDSDSVTAVVDDAAEDMIRLGRADYRMLQRNCVAIPRGKARMWGLREIAPDIYRWEMTYDGFLGYMAGAVPELRKNAQLD